MNASNMAFFRRRAIVTYFVPMLFLAFAISGCRQQRSSPQATEPSGPLLTINPATTGSISGTVTLEGNPPVMGAVETPCGNSKAARAVPQVVVKGSHGELAYAVIYLKSGLANYRYNVPQDAVTLDQKGCMYEPHVLALMTNQPLEIRNDDPVAHNIHPLAKINKQWNRSEPPGAAPMITSFPRPELAMHVICKVHPWMSAFLFIFDNPYYAVTSTDGTFDLKNVPPGTYTVEAWQEQFGTQDQTVTMGPNESKTIAFVFKGGNSSAGD